MAAADGTIALCDAGVILRPERATDRAFALSLYSEQRTPELAGVPWSPIDKMRFLTQQFAAQETHYAMNHLNAERWIVMREGQPRGRLYLAPHRHWWWLLEIGLVAAARGSGTGTALIEWTIARAAAGRAGVELRVVPDNVRAIALYRRLGFVDAPPHDDTRRRMRRAYRPN